MSVLAGYRVVELATWVAGPAAGGIMADWGADVIKVETPSGDPFRRLFGVIGGHGQTEVPPFELDNRGKRSVVLDLRTETDRATLEKLLDRADVFLTNLRPDALERLDLEHTRVLKRHPQLVYASVTGYGLVGPDRDRAGYDVGAFAARAGIAHLQGEAFGEPITLRPGFGDHVTAITALSGILAALLRREKTGQGQLVATSLLRSGIYCIGWDLGIQMRFDKLAPFGGRSDAGNPLVNSYRAAEGRWFWLLGLESERHWPNLLAALDDDALAGDERFADARGRRKNSAACVAALDAIFATRSRDEWTKRFDEHDVWWAPVNTAADVLADPQAHAGGAFVDGAVASPVDFGAAPATRPRPVPALGEHTDEVLRDLT